MTLLKVVALHTDGAREDGLHSHMLSLSPLSRPGYPCPCCDSLSFVTAANIRFSLSDICERFYLPSLFFIPSLSLPD